MNKRCVFCEVGIVWLHVIETKFSFERFYSCLEQSLVERCKGERLNTRLTSLRDLAVSLMCEFGFDGFQSGGQDKIHATGTWVSGNVSAFG